jgi:hypothetical protein
MRAYGNRKLRRLFRPKREDVTRKQRNVHDIELRLFIKHH